MSVELLTEDAVIPYLRDRQVICGMATCEILTGGVSNAVFAVTTDTQALILKQALPELKVATLWKADQRRAIVEAKALELFHTVTPNYVPALIDMDPDRFTLVLARVAKGGSVWKEDLLGGVIDPTIAIQLGETLAAWHNYGIDHSGARNDFQEDGLFDQLRVDPFYRFVALANPPLERQILLLIEEITQQKITLVHGDFSPKNVMVLNSHPWVIDYEVTHFGNPVFDLAFLSAHLLCKFFRTESLKERDLLRECAVTFLSTYTHIFCEEVSDSLGSHTALIALARVEGKSPVNYLDERAKGQLVARTKESIQNGGTFHELFKEVL